MATEVTASLNAVIVTMGDVGEVIVDVEIEDSYEASVDVDDDLEADVEETA